MPRFNLSSSTKLAALLFAAVFLPTLGLEFIMQPDLEKYSRESALNGVTCEYYIPLAS